MGIFDFFTKNDSSTEISYPTRNMARGLINAFKQNNVDLHIASANSILWFEKKFNYQQTTFVFTNALIDMVEQFEVDDENKTDSFVLLNNKKSISEIDHFFTVNFGDKLEDIIKKENKNHPNFSVKITNSGSENFNQIWFNNSDKFIHPLIIAYQNFKKEKGMLVLKDDIAQIPIDYSIIGCHKHYVQNGFLNNKIINQIVAMHTNAANECLNTIQLKPSNIEYVVKKDLFNPLCINAALDFIKQM